ncbi:hypothetical protein [Streptomyces sp. NPDC048663]|uniref:hypothetical protein n=1 Tax=Streptomyces sp. NPDC048663 TaxID=3155638 RepID=UPI0034465A33
MTYVTIGGCTVGLCILIFHLVEWWPSGGFKTLRGNPLHYAADLAPFLLAWCYGCLTILGVGGFIGWAARTALWISNWLGDVAIVWGVGGTAGAHTTGHPYQPLSQVGGAVVLVLTAGLAAAVKKTRYGNDIKRGAWCGVCLGTSAGIAGFAAAPLAIAANWLGVNTFGRM